MTDDIPWDEWLASRRNRTARLRQVIRQDLDGAGSAFEAALALGGATTFEWHGHAFRVDRVRGFIVPGGDDTDPPETLSPDTDDIDLIDIYAGEYQMETAGVFTEAWAQLAGGYRSASIWEIPLAKFFNLAVAQKRVNPAFPPLFWLLLGDELGPGPLWDWSPNIYKRIGSMIHLFAEYAEAAPSPREIRQAQVAFLESLFPGAAGPDSERLSEAEWAERCEAQLRLHQQMVDDQFFDVVLQRIDAEPGGSFD